MKLLLLLAPFLHCLHCLYCCVGARVVVDIVREVLLWKAALVLTWCYVAVVLVEVVQELLKAAQF